MDLLIISKKQLFGNDYSKFSINAHYDLKTYLKSFIINFKIISCF